MCVYVCVCVCMCACVLMSVCVPLHEGISFQRLVVIVLLFVVLGDMTSLCCCRGPTFMAAASV